MATQFDFNPAQDSQNFYVDQFFKTVKKDPDSPRAGQKRADLRMQFPIISPEEISSERAQVLAHELVASYAKKLISQNSENWDFIPDSENCNFSLAYADLIAESNRGYRKLSAEILKELCKLYASFATEAGKSQRAVENGIRILESRLKLISGADQELITGFNMNLVGFADWLEAKNYPDSVQIGAQELCRIGSELLQVLDEITLDLI